MKLPVGVSGLVKLLDANGWAHELTHGIGTIDATTKGAPRGDGTHPRVVIAAPCVSIAVRARHERLAREVRALYVARTDKDKRTWTMATAWRGRHADEHTPVPLSATELKAYIAETFQVLGADQ